MKFSRIFVLFSLLRAIESVEDFPDHCQELFDDNIHPSECCKLPSREIHAKHLQQCKNLCKSDESKTHAGCCELECIYGVTGVLKDGELVTEAVVELFENFLRKNGGGRYDKWMGIVEESVAECSSAVDKTSNSLVCNIPEFLTDFLDCVDSRNFQKCPNFRDSKACNKTREIFTEDSDCGRNFGGIFVVNHRVWNKKD